MRRFSILARTPPRHLSRKPGKRQWLNWAALFSDSKSRSHSLPKTQNATKPRPRSERLVINDARLKWFSRHPPRIAAPELERGDAPALVRSLSSQVVHPVWCGLEIPTLDLAYKACNFGIHIYRHSGCMA